MKRTKVSEKRQRAAYDRFLARQKTAESLIDTMRFFGWHQHATAEVIAKTLTAQQIKSLETMIRRCEEQVLIEVQKEASYHDFT